MKSSNYYMLAKTMFGFEEILAKELVTLGAQNVKILNRAVSFKGDKVYVQSKFEFKNCTKGF